MNVFDRLGTPAGSMLPMLGGLMVAVAAAAYLRRREGIDAERLGQHYVKAVRQRLYARLLGTSLRSFGRHRKGELLLKFVGDLSALRRWISLGLARLMVAGIAVATAMAALGWLYWPFAAAIAAAIGLSAAWILWRSGAVRASIAEARRRQGDLSANVTEKLGHLATVQAFGQARREKRLLERQSDRLLQASVRRAARLGSLRAMIDATAGACLVLVLLLAYLAPPPDLSAGMIAAVISIIGFLTPPLRDLGRAQEYWLAAQVARDNLDRVAERFPRLRSRRHAPLLDVNGGRVTFDRVSVRGVLRRVSAEAPAGARIALLGPNGAGKSTLLNLAGRLFDPDRGRVLIDGQDIARVRLSSLRRQVAFVGADVPLLRGTLRKNLCYGAVRVDDGRLREMIAFCGLEGLVDRHPRGLDARVAEGGRDLSQGERMRVALARALLAKPRVLLLDEADAGLDSEAIAVLNQVIKGFQGTLLMATHRRSVLSGFDGFWVFNEGRVKPLDGEAVVDDRAGRVVPIAAREAQQREGGSR
jgi:ABC-type multidrug transport system fused ATPase/permease subunit